MFGLRIEKVRGGRYPSGEMWLWARCTGRGRQREYRLVRSWPVVAAEGAPWEAWSNGAGTRRWFLKRNVPEFRDRYHNGRNGRLVRYGSFESALAAADRLNAL